MYLHFLSCVTRQKGHITRILTVVGVCFNFNVWNWNTDGQIMALKEIQSRPLRCLHIINKTVCFTEKHLLVLNSMCSCEPNLR